MANDKLPMQADGKGSKGRAGPAAGTRGAGASGGGPYPNPHEGKSPKSGFVGHGGQTDVEQKAPGKRHGDIGKA